MNEKEKDRLSGLFFMPEIFYIQDIFRKSKKILIGNRNFWEKAIFIGYRWKITKARKALTPYDSCTIQELPPLVAVPPPLPRLCRGHYGHWAFRSIGFYGSYGGKTIQPGEARLACFSARQGGFKVL